MSNDRERVEGPAGTVDSPAAWKSESKSPKVELWVDQQQPRGTTVAFALRRDYCRKKAALLPVYTARDGGGEGAQEVPCFRVKCVSCATFGRGMPRRSSPTQQQRPPNTTTAPYVEELKSSRSVGRKHHVPGVAPLHIVRVLCASHRQQNGGDATKRPDRGLLLPHSRTFYQDPSCAVRVLLLRCPPKDATTCPARQPIKSKLVAK